MLCTKRPHTTPKCLKIAISSSSAGHRCPQNKEVMQAYKNGANFRKLAPNYRTFPLSDSERQRRGVGKEAPIFLKKFARFCPACAFGATFTKKVAENYCSVSW